jgi:glycosyltransferase involved in cell wall biosynthesis
METRLMAAHEVFDAIDLFVAPSASIAEQFERLGLPAGKLRVSDYGFAPMPPAPRQPHELALRIGFAGTLVWHKGAHVLLDAVRQLPGSSWELKIFGSADTFPDYVEELRRKAAGLPVAFMGAFDHERTAGVYAQMDVLVVPSVWLENSPLVIHEAFMTRVPVVGARIGGIPDLVTDGVDGLLFDAGSPQALASALRRLIDRPGLLAELAERAPRVKPLVEDVADWNARYAEVSARRTGLRAAP